MAKTPYYTKAEADAKNRQTLGEIKQTTEAISAGEGGVCYDTLAEAQALVEKPLNGTVFQVNADPDPDKIGFWKFDSSQPNGTKFLRRFPNSVPLVPGKNLIDISKIIYDSGYADIVGTFYDNVDDSAAYEGWCRLPLIEVEGNTTYTLSGVSASYVGNMYTETLDRVARISENPVTGSLTFTTRATAKYLGINVKSSGYELGTNIQLEKGSAVTEYKPFQLGITKDKIIEDVLDVEGLNSILGGQKLANGGYVHYNGIDAFSTLKKEYILKEDGDYLEFRADVLDLDDFRRYSLFGKLEGGNGNNIVIDKINGQVQLRLRGNSTNWISFFLPSSWKNDIYKIELASNATEINLYRNNALTNTKAFADGSIAVKDIGNAYSTPYTFFNLYHFKISTSEGEIISLKDFYEKNTHKNTEIKEVLEVDYSETYVSLDLTGSSTGNERFTIYSRNGKTNEYLGFKVDHEVKASIYSDQWRLVGADFYQFDGVQMVPTGLMALTNGESESVYKRQPKDDFSGGYHGDEMASDVKFYIDGVKILDSELTDFTLKPCKEFSYRQISTVHTAPEGGVDATGHPVEAIRHKETTFREMTYETFVRYNWQMEIIDFARIYMNMVCVAIPIGTYGENMNFTNVAFDELGGRKLRGPGNWLRQYNPNNGTSVIIEASTNIQNDTAIQEIWDISNYHKYYRDINPNDNIQANIGDIWEGRTKVNFFKS